VVTLRASEPITYLGRTNFRNQRQRFGIKQADRRSHLYIIGKPGTGKSTLLETLIRQDLAVGRGLALVDPHGDLVEWLIARVPQERAGDVIYFNVPDASEPLGFNPLAGVPLAKQPLAASGLLDAFKKTWADSWGPRLEHILRNALMALLSQPQATLADVPGCLTIAPSGETPLTGFEAPRCGTSGCGSTRAIPLDSGPRPSRRFRTKSERFSPILCFIASSRSQQTPSTCAA
jgi:hypothetical protein